MTDVLSTARPETTEFELVSALAGRVVAAGAEPLVLLCNGSSRSEFRHPLATHSPLGRRAMAVVCARRDGLVANITRWVRFDAGTPEELDAEARIAAVEADIFDATVPGARLDRIFAEIKAAYVRHGFGADQWEQHHQGGPAGYAGRDPRVTAAATDTVVLDQAVHVEPVRARRQDRGHSPAHRGRACGPDGGRALALHHGQRPASARSPCSSSPRSLT